MVLTRRGSRSVGAVVASTVAVLVTTALPASAATRTFSDKAGDLDHPSDLRAVTVVNREGAVRVTVEVRDLRKSGPKVTGGSVFLDTDGDREPDYVLTGGFFAGTDYALLRTSSWSLRETGERVLCDYALHPRYADDLVRMRLDTDCFEAEPGEGPVRVEVRVAGSRPDGGVAVDWLRSPRSFGAAVARS
ncbi:hypothetical protein [Nocardioides kribbensis]|uniref:hypothetical protein n=2 Tax=Nocardioides TaxID=1839 RepID=UPI0032DA3DD1